MQRTQMQSVWMEGITNSTNMSLGKLREIAKDREAWQAVVHRVTKRHDLVTEQQESERRCPSQTL